ncbi:unnamed protein product [Ambrosiozyma monospora]|uniref:3-methyl-2-oxobutanoate hydroxymethyltransferase n=1 Tax=Ambrosiozyma monospora TaxID=43982 RepID=A0A9W6YP74_AMBMO|nr:unnamed protein product [Ambrosiozyma monospora]
MFRFLPISSRLSTTKSVSGPHLTPLLRHYSAQTTVRQHTLADINKLYNSKTPISVVTAHDYITGRLADASKVDIVLIGDSLAMVAKGFPSTLEIPFDDYYYSCLSVLRGISSKYVIADLPFGSFESSLEKCVESAMKLMKLGKIGSLKIEGSYEFTREISRLIQLGIPVTGHIGLQPQKFNALGGYKVQGKLSTDAVELYKQALFLQDLGCSMLVLECIPYKLAKFLTDNLRIPTIGIGAGQGTSAQVLVMSDLLGMLNEKSAKFVKPYMNFNELGLNAVNSYSEDVKSHAFPNDHTHGYVMKDQEFEDFVELAKHIRPT